MPMKAVQQFQLGTVLGTEQKALATMERMKKAGFEGIELCAFMIHPTPFMVKMLTKAAGMPVGNGGKLDWPAMIKQSGLQVPSVHQYLNSIEQDPDAAAKEAETFGAKYVTVTGMYRFDYGNAANVHELARRLNKAGEALKTRGVELLYHNHNIEFGRTDSGDRAFKILVTETDPASVNFEFDSYWAADAGMAAIEIMRCLGERMRLYHINDRGVRQKGPAMTPILKMDSMELGTGCMDLPPLIEQAKSVNVEAIILESHRNWIDGDPVKSFEVSGRYLSQFV